MLLYRINRSLILKGKQETKNFYLIQRGMIMFNKLFRLLCNNYKKRIFVT